MINSMEEKRLAKRSKVETGQAGVTGEVQFPVLNDISTGGMQFSALVGQYDIRKGDFINFNIKFHDSQENSIWGEIRHTRDFDDHTTHYGVKFLKVNWPVWNYLSKYQHDVIEITGIQKLPNEDLEKLSNMQQKVTPDSYHVKLVTDKPFDGELQDINFGGARFHLGDAVEIDNPVTTTFFFEKNMLVVEGTCVWCSHINQETKSFLVGVNFKRLDQKQFYLLSELVLKLSHLV